MDALALARWQFGITTVYHFIFVPLTIGLAPPRRDHADRLGPHGQRAMLRLTKFFGKLLLINFAIGVATGIVQEFQFGMAWSEYSRFVGGDVFGAPARDGGAGRLLRRVDVPRPVDLRLGQAAEEDPPRVHLGVAIATNLSAFFILAANSWMQHPVGTILNEERGRAEMADIGAVLTNSTLWAAFPHTISAAFLTAGTFVAAIAAWWMVKLARRGVRARRPATCTGRRSPSA